MGCGVLLLFLSVGGFWWVFFGISGWGRLLCCFCVVFLIFSSFSLFVFLFLGFFPVFVFCFLFWFLFFLFLFLGFVLCVACWGCCSAGVFKFFVLVFLSFAGVLFLLAAFSGCFSVWFLGLLVAAFIWFFSCGWLGFPVAFWLSGSAF